MKKGNKRVFLSLLLFVLVLSGCTGKEAQGPQQPAAESTESIAVEATAANHQSAPVFFIGLYEGMADGYGGELKVEVAVSAEKIESITVTEHHETQGIGTIAIEQLPEQIVALQSLEVDTITGCTRTSEAILQAVEQALSNAAVTDWK